MPIKKPKRFSFDAREKHILETASHLFSTDGFHGTTTKSIAKRAGVNEALLFRHFSGKESLYLRLIEIKLADWSKTFIPRLEKTTPLSLADALMKIAKNMVLSNKKDPSLLRMMLFVALENKRLGPLFFKRRLPLVDFLEKFFERYISEKKIRPIPNAQVMTRAFIGLIHHYIIISQVFRPKKFYPKRENEMLKNFVEIFVKGILR